MRTLGANTGRCWETQEGGSLRPLGAVVRARWGRRGGRSRTRRRPEGGGLQRGGEGSGEQRNVRGASCARPRSWSPAVPGRSREEPAGRSGPRRPPPARPLPGPAPLPGPGVLRWAADGGGGPPPVCRRRRTRRWWEDRKAGRGERVRGSVKGEWEATESRRSAGAGGSEDGSVEGSGAFPKRRRGEPGCPCPPPALAADPAPGGAGHCVLTRVPRLCPTPVPAMFSR